MFKRVISNPEELGHLSKKASTGPSEEDTSRNLIGSSEFVGAKELADSNQGHLWKPFSHRSPDPNDAPVMIESDSQDYTTPAMNDSSGSFRNSKQDSNKMASGDTAKQKDAAETVEVAKPVGASLIRASGSVMRRAEELLADANSGGFSDEASAGSIRTGNSSNPGGSGNWGWFYEDVHGDKKKSGDGRGITSMGNEATVAVNPDGAAALAVTAPTYVLEESLSSQKLWKDTAGNRPPQPLEERAFYEKMWAQNFARSRVDYKMPLEVLTANSPIFLSPFADGNFDGSPGGPELSTYNFAPVSEDSRATDAEIADAIHRLHYAGTKEFSTEAPRPVVVNKKVKGSASDGDLTVLIRGDNVFGTTVSKSFIRHSDHGAQTLEGVDTVNISIASYRVVESKKRGKYAQFLVIYREGSIRDTIGVWKRYSDFENLSQKVMQAHEGCSSVLANMSPMSVTEEPEVEHLPNAIMSWRLLKKRQRWYRCLDAGYLSLKVFLLERFLHDILFESSSPMLLQEFVMADAQRSP